MRQTLLIGKDGVLYTIPDGSTIEEAKKLFEKYGTNLQIVGAVKFEVIDNKMPFEIKDIERNSIYEIKLL